ncbi:endonuclease domain-containing protein [Jiangella sp. DSM 45060]|uniref:endonuclease domain-containing protein n=1 Tax=Jiangella sp. DSM 45060 TaxID=1798224 RepID=UPI00087A2DAE|nr:DUF559 domain-containing protein [Jiangella sp. DSM 45060]SDT73002.1 Protein of unknown function [Jiangella sp. DSM 45060]
MPRRPPVPEPFGSRPFRVRDATLAGVPVDLLDGPRFRRPFRGVRVPVTVPDSLVTNCQAARLVLPDEAAFSHETAALLCDLPVPVFDGEIDVVVPPGAVVPRLAGTDGHVGLDNATVIEVHGLPVVRPERTFVHLAASWRLDDLVALGDAMLRRWATPELLYDEVAGLARRRGIVRARDAVRLIRPGVDSPMETRVRLLIVDAGLPCPEVGVNVIDHTGTWLARPDLSYPDLKIAIEYDGDHHRTDQRQWQRDRFRDEQLRDAGWIVIPLTADDVLRHPQRSVDRIRRYVHLRSTASVPLIMEKSGFPAPGKPISP